jgi:acyl-CoA synthetase (AMP-forming)/AMP-acid ligase II
MVHAGTEAGHVVFGPSSRPISALALAETGRSWFSDNADSGAVGAVMTNDQSSVQVLLGAISAGTTLVSLPLPGRNADIVEYAELVRAACAQQGLETIIVADAVAALAAGLGVRVLPHSELGERPVAAPGDGFRLVQYSSGSTQQPKPVVLDDHMLGANVQATLDVLDPRVGDVLVTWLPLSHDMGLVGMLLGGLVGMSPDRAGASSLVVLDPADFLRRPALWIEMLDRWRGTITAAPDFGFRMAIQRRPQDALDLSPLRAAIVGGEVVRADTLADFVSGFAADGLSPEALCPAYGMAEAGLAVSLTPPGEEWRERAVDASELANERVGPAAAGRATFSLVSSGPALEGYEISCGDRTDSVGPIAVRGPSVGFDGRTGRSFGDGDGWYQTGDTGFLDSGWVYVCGRTDDHLVAHGRNIYAPAIDAAVGDVDGIRRGRVTTAALPTGEWAVVVERVDQSPASVATLKRLRNDVRRAAVAIGGASPDVVAVVDRGSLPLTASGKVQRNEVRARLIRGEITDGG